jgi:hypothetical protein
LFANRKNKARVHRIPKEFLMESIKSKHLSVMVMAVLMTAVVMFAGCSKTPLGSDSETAEPTQPQLLKRAASSVQLSPSELYVEQVISAAEGGQLSLFDVTLDIPPDAVDNDTLFSICIPNIEVFYNEFGTDGLVFNTPVEVTMSYRDADLTGIDESTIRIAWFDERSGEFRDMVCEVDTDNKVVTGELNNFSAYALVSD